MPEAAAIVDNAPSSPAGELIGDDDSEGNPSLASTTEEDNACVSTVPDIPPPNLREISPLASWTVSTHKPGCGVPALLSPLTSLYWQSDGPQPHLLNIHFFKLVSIVKIRVYLDFELDESYTPTRMVFAAGMSGEYGLVVFKEWRGEGPRGWVDVGLEGCGGGGDRDGEGEGEGEEGGGGVLRCMCLQVRVLENHQNGKDTHVRGVQIFAREERRGQRVGGDIGKGEERDDSGLKEAEWMGECELR